MQPSKYQQGILDWLSGGEGNALIEARAGSGKTSTLVMLANAIPSYCTATFLAFNKSIAVELANRLPAHVSSSTFHSLAFRAVNSYLKSKNKGRFAKVNANKCAELFDAMYPPTYVGIRSATLKLVALFKAHALLPEQVTSDIAGELISHFDVEWDDDDFEADHVVCAAIDVLRASNRDTLSVDFDDMLYLVVVHNVKLAKFDFVMVDESQDTNPMQRIILKRLMHPTSRLIAVGDPAQAIYGFRGASSDAMDLICQEFDAVRLPLSISYRCPLKVVELAQRYVPDIEARDGAPEGTVLYPDAWKCSAFQADDLVVCRNTAPLVRLAYKLITARVPCKIMGREIGKGLVTLIGRVAGKRATLPTLPELLASYLDREVSKLRAVKGSEGRIQAISDKVECVLALIDGLTPADVARGIPGLIMVIESMFSDNGPNVCTLATVHKAKGLESVRTFILDAALMPSKYAVQEWQQQQERNLTYVAITRSLDTLVYLDSDRIS